jgi:hypothetical protein
MQQDMTKIVTHLVRSRSRGPQIARGGGAPDRLVATQPGTTAR